MNYQDETPIITAAGNVMPLTQWALVADGRVEIVTSTRSPDQHPFGENVPMDEPGHIPLSGECALRVTGVVVHPGYLVDEKGNVTPAEGRTETLKPGESALHAGPGVGAVQAASGAIEHEDERSDEDEEPVPPGAVVHEGEQEAPPAEVVPEEPAE